MASRRGSIDLAAGRLVHVQAHGNDGTYDDHKPPGDGRIDWTRVAAGLQSLNYDGWLTLELACPSVPLRDYFTRAARQLRELLGEKSAPPGAIPHQQHRH